MMTPPSNEENIRILYGLFESIDVVVGLPPKYTINEVQKNAIVSIKILTEPYQ